MPWSSADLPIIEPSADAWPLHFAIEWLALGPEGLTARRLRDAVRAAGLRPVGKMRWGPGKRHQPVYDAAELFAVAQSLTDRAEHAARIVTCRGESGSTDVSQVSDPERK